jgi:Protein of unknown function (DUF429)
VGTSLGIDLASQNKKTAVCRIEWSKGTAQAHRPRLGVDQPRGQIRWLLEAAREAMWVGIDAPFGWPDSMVRAVSAWHAGEAWTDTEPDQLRFRATDERVIGETGLRPLSVSSDRIAVVAWRCAAILTALRRERRDIDRLGGGGVFEVYPAAALWCWSLDGKGYKARGGLARRDEQEEARDTLLHQLEDRASWLDLRAARDTCVESDDALDALIASLVARAAAKGLTDRPRRGELDRARREGWIHLPGRDSLANLGESA